MFRIVTPLALLAVLLFAPGCAVDATDDPEDEDLDALEAPAINANRLLRNNQILGSSRMSVGEVQSLLEFYGSALADYREGGKSAARLIKDAANAHDISPLYLLARIETESGLVRSGTLAHLSSATGCGCPDSVPCDPGLAGFGLQVLCASEKMRGYFNSLASTGSTVSGWRVGVAKWTLDPCRIVPANRATAALYTYTPWVGAYASGCGTSAWGGSSLVAVLYKRFEQALADLDPAEPPPPATRFVVDNEDARTSSNWVTSNSTPGYVGSGYAFAGVRAISDAAVFPIDIADAGRYTIEARWTAGSNRSTRAPFIIQAADGTQLANIKVNQRIDGARWNRLGTFDLTRGENRVLLSRWAADGDVVIADAIRITAE